MFMAVPSAALFAKSAKCDYLGLPWITLDYLGLPWITLDYLGFMFSKHALPRPFWKRAAFGCVKFTRVPPPGHLPDFFPLQNVKEQMPFRFQVSTFSLHGYTISCFDSNASSHIQQTSEFSVASRMA
jgi:hypothetical protein